MESKINPPRLTRVVALAFVATLVFASPSYAQMFPQLVNILEPHISFDLNGETTYDPLAQVLSIKATTTAFKGVGTPPCILLAPPPAIPPTFTFTIRVHVNNSGALVPGVPGDGFVATGGQVDPAAIPEFFCNPPGPTHIDLAGVLMSGTVLEFGYRASPDQLVFRVALDGGAFFTAGLPEVAVKVNLDTGLSTFTGDFVEPFVGVAVGDAGAFTSLLAAKPTVTTSNLFIGPSGPGGAIATFTATATDFQNQPLAVTCDPASGSVFPIGLTTVICTSAPDIFGEKGTAQLAVTVSPPPLDTTPPAFFCGDDIDANEPGACDIFGIQATGPDGASVEFDVTASDLVSGAAAVTCSPVSGSLFAIGSTPVTCNAKDAALNTGTLTFTVEVIVVPPAPRDGCFIVDFREITYFNQRKVITSSDAGIRTRNGILVAFNPTGDRRWPYRPNGGTGYTTSRGTLFRIYGFQPAEEGQRIPHASDPFLSYLVQKDDETKGYYIDTGGPARVSICPGQLHNYVLGGRKRYGHMDGSTRLPRAQRNVPGIMLTHNSQILRLPAHVKAEMDQLLLPHGPRGVIDYIGFQLQGNGSAPFREFVDVEVLFPQDSETDRAAHFARGFHTATNTNFETFAGCSYVDYAPGNDAVRLRDAWGPNRPMLEGVANSSWLPCGALELAVNQKVRANYEVPFNAIQILPTVNTNTDTLRLFYGEIRPAPERLRRAND